LNIQDTKLTTEVRSIRELNLYLLKGWVLILTYVKHSNDSQQPCFIVAWQSDGQPETPELLDEWELSEMDKQKYR